MRPALNRALLQNINDCKQASKGMFQQVVLQMPKMKEIGWRWNRGSQFVRTILWTAKTPGIGNFQRSNFSSFYFHLSCPQESLYDTEESLPTKVILDSNWIGWERQCHWSRTISNSDSVQYSHSLWMFSVDFLFTQPHHLTNGHHCLLLIVIIIWITCPIAHIPCMCVLRLFRRIPSLLLNLK